MADVVVRKVGEERRITVGPAEARFQLTGADTGGAFAMCEFVAEAGFPGPPPHIHRAHDETFYILEGELTLTAGDATVRATPGMCVFVPRGVGHSFSNATNRPARLLGIFTPAGYERYFEEVAALAGGEMLDPAKTYAIMAKYDTEPAQPNP